MKTKGLIMTVVVMLVAFTSFAQPINIVQGGNNDITGNAIIGQQNYYAVELWTNNTPQAIITNLGLFGIGTASPVAHLDVQSNVEKTPRASQKQPSP